MTSERPLRLGTRGSLLARTQSQWVADRVTAATGRAVDLVIISTRGDQVRDRPLAQVGGKGLFTKELEDALLDGDLDFAVHSLKDMPTEGPEGLTIGCVPVREDPRDALVGRPLAELPAGAVVGTGSARRRAQILHARPDLEVRGIRGNVPTRIRKMREGDYDTVVLAAAGLRRLDMADRIAEVLPVDTMIPAAGQGALAVQYRSDDEATAGLLATIHDSPTARCVEAERAFLATLEGGCSAPIAAHVREQGDQVVILGFLERGAVHRDRREAPVDRAIELARAMARDFLGAS